MLFILNQYSIDNDDPCVDETHIPNKFQSCDAWSYLPEFTYIRQTHSSWNRKIQQQIFYTATTFYLQAHPAIGFLNNNNNSWF